MEGDTTTKMIFTSGKNGFSQAASKTASDLRPVKIDDFHWLLQSSCKNQFSQAGTLKRTDSEKPFSQTTLLRELLEKMFSCQKIINIKMFCSIFKSTFKDPNYNQTSKEHYIDFTPFSTRKRQTHASTVIVAIPLKNPTT